MDSTDPTGDFLEACIARPDVARAMATADPSLLHAERLGSPPLHWLVIEDYPAGVPVVLELGVPVDARDQGGNSALHHAARLGRLGCARILLARGANPNKLHEPQSENPLNLAVARAHLDVVVLLLDHGARADYHLPTGDTIFRQLSHHPESVREFFVSQLADRGITRDGVFRALQLDRLYASPEEAFLW